MRLFRRLPIILSAICFLAFLAAPAAAVSFRPQGGISTATLNTLYCKLTGCTMSGNIIGSGGTSNNPMFQVDSGKMGMWSVASGTRLGIGGTGSGLLMIDLNVSTSTVSINDSVLVGGNLRSQTSTMTDATTGTCNGDGTVTVTGTALDGTITATCLAGHTVIVTFSTGFGASPNCTITSANSAAGAVTTGTPFQSAGTTTSATFTFPAVTTGKYNVHCML